MTNANQNFQWTTYTAILGSVLARHRTERGIGQVELVQRLPISHATWSRIERGIAPITVEQLQEFADLIEIPSDQLLREANRIRWQLQEQGVVVLNTRPAEPASKGLMLLGAAALGGIVATLLAKDED